MLHVEANAMIQIKNFKHEKNELRNDLAWFNMWNYVHSAICPKET